MILILMSMGLGVIVKTDDYSNAKTYDAPLHRKEYSNNINCIKKALLKTVFRYYKTIQSPGLHIPTIRLS